MAYALFAPPYCGNLVMTSFWPGTHEVHSYGPVPTGLVPNPLPSFSTAFSDNTIPLATPAPDSVALTVGAKISFMMIVPEYLLSTRTLSSAAQSPW